MMFIGGRSERVNFKNHTFSAVFFELEEEGADEEETPPVWSRTVSIPQVRCPTKLRVITSN